MIDVDERVGFWLAAALEDPSVCDEMKADIAAWMRYHEPRHELRDMAERIDRVARAHFCFSQAHEIVACCCNHLRAIALINDIHTGREPGK